MKGKDLQAIVLHANVQALDAMHVPVIHSCCHALLASHTHNQQASTIQVRHHLQICISSSQMIFQGSVVLHRTTCQQTDSGCDGTPRAPLCGGHMDHLAQWRHCSAAVPHTSSRVSKPSLHISSYHDDFMMLTCLFSIAFMVAACTCCPLASPVCSKLMEPQGEGRALG